MAKEMVGLVGKGKGPHLCVEAMATQLHAVVRGLSDKCPPVVITVWHEHGFTGHMVEKNGVLELPMGHAVRFEYEGSRTPICILRMA